MMRAAGKVLLATLLVLCGCAVVGGFERSADGASRLAPEPAHTREAVIQVYGARTRGAKGLFGIHTWVAVKPEGAAAYTVYEVIGWRLQYGSSPVVVRQREPDAPWFGSPAELIADRRGPEAAALIDRVDKAARSYPWPNEYTVWPGPNSNTFTAWIARAVPELKVDLPPTAIGKDYAGTSLLGRAPSGSGLQLTVFGLLGLMASPVEGLEFNLLGLTLGVNPFDPSLKLPILGRLGAARRFATPGSAVEKDATAPSLSGSGQDVTTATVPSRLQP